LLVAAGGVVWTAAAGGQAPGSDTFINQQRQVEERVRLQLQETLPAYQKVQFDWGGWFTGYWFLFDDGIESSRTLRRPDLRLWGSLNLDEGIHQGYARMRLAYNDFNPGDSFDGNEDDLEGPNLDRGWYRLDLTRLLRKYQDLDLPFDLQFKVGRQYVLFGSGYALSTPLDAVTIAAKVEDFKITGLLGRTIASENNIDASRFNANRSWRYFYGVEARYVGFEKHEPFFYYIWQKDRQGDGNPLLRLQQWRYDSQYLGLGCEGELLRNTRYGCEFVYQRGRSYGNGAFLSRDDICAYGWDMELQYLHPGRTQPQFSLEYMFASGDPDRLFSPTTAVGGNRPGTRDRGFNAFGFRDTGLALAPDLSNLHIWRAGASFFPFEKSEEWLRRLELGTDWFLYHKHRTQAAISDPLADRRSGFVGWEMDCFFNWRFTVDLAWTVRYGVFFPGKAFSDRTTRTFLLSGLTWSF